MSKCSIGIYDTETEYARKLGAYIMLKEGAGFEPHIFTDEDKLMKSLPELDFALVPEEFSNASDNPKLVRLVERYDSMPGQQIEKYHRAPELVARMRDLFDIRDTGDAKDTGKIVCVVSPARHELQMLFTLCLCKEWSISSRVLYVNLLEASGFSGLFDCKDSRNLEDLIADCQETDQSPEAYVCLTNGISSLAPCMRPEALWETDGDAVIKILRLLENSSYERIVLDMGPSFPGSYEIYKSAARIMTLGRDGFLSDESEREWENNLKRHLGDEVLEKVERFTLPLSSAGIRGSDFLLDELHRGNLGDYIREHVEA